jgi:hypothetical protein
VGRLDILPGIERVKVSLTAAARALIDPGDSSGSQSDPALVETFLTVADESRRVSREYTDSGGGSRTCLRAFAPYLQHREIILGRGVGLP